MTLSAMRLCPEGDPEPRGGDTQLSQGSLGAPGLRSVHWRIPCCWCCSSGAVCVALPYRPFVSLCILCSAPGTGHLLSPPPWLQSCTVTFISPLYLLPAQGHVPLPSPGRVLFHAGAGDTVVPSSSPAPGRFCIS